MEHRNLVRHAPPTFRPLKYRRRIILPDSAATQAFLDLLWSLHQKYSARDPEKWAEISLMYADREKRKNSRMVRSCITELVERYRAIRLPVQQHDDMK